MTEFLRIYLIFVALVGLLCGIVLLYDSVKHNEPFYIIPSFLCFGGVAGLIYVIFWIIP